MSGDLREIYDRFGDAAIASVCKNIKGSVVVTFDRKFIERLKALKLNVQIFKEK